MTADDLLTTRQYTPDVAALTLFGSLRTLDSQYRLGFVMRGLVLREVEDRELWKHVDAQYHSLNHFIAEALPWSERDSYYALRAAKDLADIPLTTLAEIPRVNVEKLRLMSTAVRAQPAVLEAATTLSEARFVDFVKEFHPDQALEHKRALPKLTESTRAVMDEAIEKAMRVEGCTSRNEAVVAIATAYLQAEVSDESQG